MSKLTDEKIYRITQQLWGAGACHSEYQKFARAIESAATEPLLQRIAELEGMNAQLREQNTEVDKACAELERQLEEARKDAERYRHLRSHCLPAGHGSITIFLDDRCGTGDRAKPLHLEDLDAAVDENMKGQQ